MTATKGARIYRRQTYEIEIDDVRGYGGRVLIDRYPDGVRILVIDRVGGREARANVVMSRREAARLARQITAMARP